MDFYLGPSLEPRQEIGPQLVIANKILLYSSAELETLLDEELSENPALEVEEVARCPRCGAALSGREQRFCARCNRLIGDLQPLPWEAPSISDGDPSSDDEWSDPILRIVAPTSLSDYLMWQLRPVLEPGEEPLATFLVESLDERGFLSCSLEEASGVLGCGVEALERVLAKIHDLDPPGVGARGAQECLLLQMRHLERQGKPVPPLARQLVEQCWEALSRGALRQVQRSIQATLPQIREALDFLQECLTPYPALAHWEVSPQGRAQTEPVGDYVRPDIVLSEREDGGIEIELPGARSYELRINPLFAELASDRRAHKQMSESEYACVRECVDRARLFIRGMEQRWVTLRLIMLALVREQEAFIRHGPRHLKPLTRAQLADSLGLHESIVSRAVANKYVQLPNSRIVPMSIFFDDSLPVKEVIREIIAQEEGPLSDQEIAAELARRGYQVARRTVAKYRDALGILPAALRFRGGARQGASAKECGGDQGD